jgi:hypothetical protein
VNIVEAKEVVLTDHHLCLVMEYAAGNSLTGGRSPQALALWPSAAIALHLPSSTGCSTAEAGTQASQWLRCRLRGRQVAARAADGAVPVRGRGTVLLQTICHCGGVLPCAQRRPQVLNALLPFMLQAAHGPDSRWVQNNPSWWSAIDREKSSSILA